jgi:hypothetical protein
MRYRYRGNRSLLVRAEEVRRKLKSGNLPSSGTEHISKLSSEDSKRLNFAVPEKCLAVGRPNRKLPGTLHSGTGTTFDKTILQDITFVGQLGKMPELRSQVVVHGNCSPVKL